MYFWNIQALEQDLKEWLSEKENMKYLMVYVVLFTIGTLPIITDTNIYDYILSFYMIAFVIIEIILLYKVNKWNDGKNFLSRYFSIGWVLLLRSLVFIMIPLFIIYIFINVYFLSNPDLESTNVSDHALNAFYTIWYLYLQVQSFKRVNA